MTTEIPIRECDETSDTSSEDLDFSALDFGGVNFDDGEEKTGCADAVLVTTPADERAISLERQTVFHGAEDGEMTRKDDDPAVKRILELSLLSRNGQYADILRHATAQSLLVLVTDGDASVYSTVRNNIFAYCDSVAKCVEVELVGVAALCLYLQLNYTGPSVEEDSLKDVNPHSLFRREEEDVGNVNDILSELAVDGEWPFQLCEGPYFLLLARSILSTLSDPTRHNWSVSIKQTKTQQTSDVTGSSSCKSEPHNLSSFTAHLQTASLWSARAAVAHERLIQTDYPSPTLWREVEREFSKTTDRFCNLSGDDIDNDNDINMDMDIQSSLSCQELGASVMLEWGLAQHHFDRAGQGISCFKRAADMNKLNVQVTGATGKRTKFQQKATAQMLVKAFTHQPQPLTTPEISKEEQISSPTEIAHSEEEILLDRILFDSPENNTHQKLSLTNQTILLSLCLDVKNKNPVDALTGEQMAAYLSRVLLDATDDWMIYATGLLERAWLEFERSHGRERAILQIQALVDQHTNRLTLTQSTIKAAVHDSAPPQTRLRNIHAIVYPPRWGVQRDLAERYASMGIVTSAAEIYQELEMWDEVVECYRFAGKSSKAEKIVRDRLEKKETPRMWTALGDLTDDPQCFMTAISMSRGTFSDAFLSLGKHHFQEGRLTEAAEELRKCLKIKPSAPQVWFLLGTISMRVGDWNMALIAFTEVVQQNPQEGDAWANVAAVHIHNRMPEKAYHAINESLKQNRKNWRVWVSKLYTCIDLFKYDEAVQACLELLKFKTKKSESDPVQAIEEKCARAIVVGSFLKYSSAVEEKDTAAVDSARRTLVRVGDLLKTMSAEMNSKAWIYDLSAYFNERLGRSDKVIEDLLREYRTLQAKEGWDMNSDRLARVCEVALQISIMQREEGSKENLVKGRMMLNGLKKKILAAYIDTTPKEVSVLDEALGQFNDAIKLSK